MWYYKIYKDIIIKQCNTSIFVACKNQCGKSEKYSIIYWNVASKDTEDNINGELHLKKTLYSFVT